MYFELSSLGNEFKNNLEGGGEESKIWNYIHPCKLLIFTKRDSQGREYKFSSLKYRYNK